MTFDSQKITPSFSKLQSIASDYNHAAICYDCTVDMESPMSIFYKLKKNNDYQFLLESIEGGVIPSRYSILGLQIDGILTYENGQGSITWKNKKTSSSYKVQDKPLSFLRNFLKQYKVWLPKTTLPKFFGGLVGNFSYECFFDFENLDFQEKPYPVSIPLIQLFVAKETIVFDHLLRKLTFIEIIPLKNNKSQLKSTYHQAIQKIQHMIATIYETPSPKNINISNKKLNQPIEFQSNTDKEEFLEQVRYGKTLIQKGELFQIVLSLRQQTNCKVDPIQLYRALRITNPSPYMFYLNFIDYALVGASPEVLVSQENSQLSINPIAGTRPRGKTLKEDLVYEQSLLNDRKELAEHRMLVDLGRNDLGRIADHQTVEVAEQMHIEKYSHVMHLVTNLQARLKPGLDNFDILQATFPAGTVSGAPKIRACQLIQQIEKEKRATYAGAVGYISFASNYHPEGSMDVCITLRTLLVTESATYFQAGAGIVYDSIPENEFQEVQNKLASSKQAIELALKTN